MAKYCIYGKIKGFTAICCYPKREEEVSESLWMCGPCFLELGASCFLKSGPVVA